MRIQPIDRNTNFGDLCGIRCNESFRNGTYGYTNQRALLIKDLMDSEAFKKLGEKYDYDAELKFDFEIWNDETLSNDDMAYELVLTPAKKPTPNKKLPNLPVSEVTVIYSKAIQESNAYKMFRKTLNNLTLRKLERKIDSEVKFWRKLNGNDNKGEIEEAKQAIKNSKIPIDFDI